MKYLLIALLTVSSTAFAEDQTKNIAIGVLGTGGVAASAFGENLLRKEHRGVWTNALPAEMKGVNAADAAEDFAKKEFNEQQAIVSDLNERYVNARDGYSTYHTERKYAWGPIYERDTQTGHTKTTYGFDWRDVQIETRHAPNPALARQLKPQLDAATAELNVEEKAFLDKKLELKNAKDKLAARKVELLNRDPQLKSTVSSLIRKRVLNGGLGVISVGTIGYAAYSAINASKEKKDDYYVRDTIGDRERSWGGDAR